MTNAMTMTSPAPLRVHPRMSPARREQLRRRRRRKALMEFLLDGLATIGISACFVLCAVMLLCVA